MKLSPHKTNSYRSSFKHALTGIQTAFNEERNFRTHIFAAVLAILFGISFNIDYSEWLWLLLAIFLVIVTEIINTAFENVVDLITLEFHPQAKVIKDMSAAAVLLISLFAIIVGLFIFIPKIYALL